MPCRSKPFATSPLPYTLIKSCTYATLGATNEHWLIATIKFCHFYGRLVMNKKMFVAICVRTRTRTFRFLLQVVNVLEMLSWKVNFDETKLCREMLPLSSMFRHYIDIILNQRRKESDLQP